jgi:hypothetical protein
MMLGSVKYYLIVSFDEGDFIQEVNEYLDNGWSLYGDLNMAVDEDGLVYGQAVVRDKVVR